MKSGSIYIDILQKLNKQYEEDGSLESGNKILDFVDNEIPNMAVEMTFDKIQDFAPPKNIYSAHIFKGFLFGIIAMFISVILISDNRTFGLSVLGVSWILGFYISRNLHEKLINKSVFRHYWKLKELRDQQKLQNKEKQLKSKYLGETT